MTILVHFASLNVKITVSESLTMATVQSSTPLTIAEYHKIWRGTNQAFVILASLMPDGDATWGESAPSVAIDMDDPLHQMKLFLLGLNEVLVRTREIVASTAYPQFAPSTSNVIGYNLTIWEKGSFRPETSSTPSSFKVAATEIPQKTKTIGGTALLLNP